MTRRRNTEAGFPGVPVTNPGKYCAVGIVHLFLEIMKAGSTAESRMASRQQARGLLKAAFQFDDTPNLTRV